MLDQIIKTQRVVYRQFDGGYFNLVKYGKIFCLFIALWPSDRNLVRHLHSLSFQLVIIVEMYQRKNCLHDTVSTIRQHE